MSDVIKFKKNQIKFEISTHLIVLWDLARARQHLGNIQINLVFLSICTIFELRSKILTFEKTQIIFGFLLT